jgi:precorrin-6B methylase 1
MNNNSIQYQNNKVTICEKVSCSSYATTKIKVNVKDIGSITLLLCDQCKLLFSDIGEKINE